MPDKAEMRLSNTSSSIWESASPNVRSADGKTDLLLGVSGLGTHVRKEGDVVKLEQSGVDIWLIGEDVNTSRRELFSVHHPSSTCLQLT